MSYDAAFAHNGSSDTAGDSFESSLERLHEIIVQLEAGDLSLDETIARFQEGSGLAQECMRMIDAAELKITELASEMSSGLDPD
ncbi:MAG TPA: exodeoxyribonuclease VII small subunit [Thermomicrobiales bacterium]|nr:exodeoxyribonuclease VII small subunit [Thermomicrobiales bacterium]